MKNMTLKEIKDKFYPEFSNQAFSKEIGMDNSYICKIMNGSYHASSNSKNWKKLEEWVKRNYEVQLITLSPFTAVFDKYEKKIYKLESKVNEQQQIINEYEKMFVELCGSVRIMATAKEAINKITKKVNFTKLKK